MIAHNPRNNTSIDLQLEIIRIKDDGNKKITPVYLENIRIDSNSIQKITDNLRTGSFNRTFTTTVTLWRQDEVYTINHDDFNTYFTSNENIINSQQNEGLVIRFFASRFGSPSGADTIRTLLKYTVI